MADRHPDRNHTVVIEVPAVPTSLRLLRLAVADVMMTGGFSVAGVERGALVVDELASVLITAVETERLSVEIDHGPNLVHVRGRVTSSARPAAVPDLDAVARDVLDAGVGDPGRWRLLADHDGLSFEATLFV